jgi:excisionase family DNA binding protein
MPTKASTRRAPRELDEVPLVLRTEDVAELLRCDLATVYALVRRGELPHVRLGRSLRFHRDALATWLGQPTEDD